MCGNDIFFSLLNSMNINFRSTDYLSEKLFFINGNFSESSESVLSNGSGEMTNSNSAGWKKIPDKLRIIKPLEGSITLNHWQNLAKPSLNGVFEERSAGIVMRGSKTTNFIAKILNEETKAIETGIILSIVDM